MVLNKNSNSEKNMPKINNTRYLQFASVVASLLFLVSCGGGGGGGNSSQGNSPQSFHVGGKVQGLAAPGLILQLNGTSDLGINANGTFSFPTTLANGSSYTVTVKANPSGQVCTVSANESGTVTSTDVTAIAVSCETSNNSGGPQTFRVGGTVSGLVEPGLVLQLNGETDFAVAVNGTFLFPTPFATGSSYTVAIKANPPNRVCLVSSNQSGIVGVADVMNVTVTCSASSGGGNPSPGSDFRVTLESNTLSFTFEEGKFSASQRVFANTSGTPPRTVFIGAVVEGRGIAPTIPVSIIGTRAEALVSPAGELPAGTYVGRILFQVCSDSECTNHIGGSPLPINYTVTVVPVLKLTPEALSFSGFNGDALPSQALSLPLFNGKTGTWIASSSAPWLKLTKSSGTLPERVDAIFDVVQAPASGNYSAYIDVSATVAGAVTNRRIPVSLQLNRPSLILSAENLSFSAVNGAPILPETLSVRFDSALATNVAVAASSPWLTLSKSSGRTPDSFTVGVNPAIGSLTSGTYNSSIHLTLRAGGDAFDIDVPVSMTLIRPTLVIGGAGTLLGGDLGRTFAVQPLSIQTNTGSNSYRWTMIGGATWLSINRTNGSTSSVADSIQLTPDRLKASPGTNTALLTFSTKVNGDDVSTTVPVKFNLDTHKLLASETGVAFTKTPSWARLSRTVKVTSNLNLPVIWSAKSDHAWLSVTGSGTAGDDLVLTANPTGLAVDQLYTATVTITCADVTISTRERIKIGFWVGSNTPSGQSRIFDGLMYSTVVDPIRPYVYVRTWDPEIRAYNIYTGTESTPRITLPGSPPLREMTVSNDGESLFVVDSSGNILPINLSTREVGVPIILTSTGARDSVFYARPNGVPLLLAGGEVRHASGIGENLGFGLTYSNGAVTADGKKIFVTGGQRYDVDYTSVDGGKFYISLAGSAIPTGNVGGDIATSRDGRQVYEASSEAPEVFQYNGLTLTSASVIPGTDRAHSIEVDGDGRVFVMWNHPVYQPEIWIFNASNSLVRKLFPTIASPFFTGGSLKISADGLMATAISTSELDFIPIGP